jgi:serralysin
MADIFTTKSRDTVNGTDLPDTITDRFGANLINAGGGDDTVFAYSVDTVHGDAGDDIITSFNGGFLYGDDGDDRLARTGDDDESVLYLEGGAGNDTIDAFNQAYVMYTTATGGVTVDATLTGPQNVGGGAGTDTLLRVRYLVGSRFDDVITINGGVVLDGPGNDLVRGGALNTTFRADTGDDTYIGGSGTDTIAFDSTAPFLSAFVPEATGGVTVDLNLTTAQNVGGGFGRDTLLNIENVVGTRHADYILGNAANNVITTAVGADTILAGDGNDWVSAGNSFGPDNENFVRGMLGNDTLQGGNNFDDMLGNQGDDSMRGWGGNDWVVGGQDNDTVFGDDGNDIVYGNRGNDLVWGGLNNDTVRGGQDSDTVYGNEGDDVLAGDRGDDTLTGGVGADTFVTFGAADRDWVQDFKRSEGDRVRIEDGASWTVAQEGADTVIHVAGGATMVLANVQLSSLSGDWIGAY